MRRRLPACSASRAIRCAWLATWRGARCSRSRLLPPAPARTGLRGEGALDLGQLDEGEGRLDAAREQYAAAHALAASNGAAHLAATARNALGTMFEAQGAWTRRARHLDAALSDGARRWRGGSRRASSPTWALHLEQGRIEEARRAYEAALATARAVGDRRLEGNMLTNLGGCRQLRPVARGPRPASCRFSALARDMVVRARGSGAVQPGIVDEPGRLTTPRPGRRPPSRDRAPAERPAFRGPVPPHLALVSLCGAAARRRRRAWLPVGSCSRRCPTGTAWASCSAAAPRPSTSPARPDVPRRRCSEAEARCAAVGAGSRPEPAWRSRAFAARLARAVRLFARSTMPRSVRS